MLLVVLLIVEANSAPAFSSFDFQSLVIAALPLAFAAMAQAVIVISGGIDLSVGAQMAADQLHRRAADAAPRLRARRSLICARSLMLIGVADRRADRRG